MHSGGGIGEQRSFFLVVCLVLVIVVGVSADSSSSVSHCPTMFRVRHKLAFVSRRQGGAWQAPRLPLQSTRLLTSRQQLSSSYNTSLLAPRRRRRDDGASFHRPSTDTRLLSTISPTPRMAPTLEDDENDRNMIPFDDSYDYDSPLKRYPSNPQPRAHTKKDPVRSNSFVRNGRQQQQHQHPPARPPPPQLLEEDSVYDESSDSDIDFGALEKEIEQLDRVIDAEERTTSLSSDSVPNGNWNQEQPLEWTRTFGRRSKDYDARVKKLARLQPGDDGYFDVSEIRVPSVTIVRTVEDAKIVVQKLKEADPSTIHACDTEVMDIDLKSVGPVGNGYVTCVSIYSGKDFDYGLGDGPGSTLWIDNLDDAFGVLQEFKDWFEDERFRKVWHNYGFDRHVMWNEGIDCRGFAGDTMHMARLEDTSRSRSELSSGNGYSLEALTEELVKRRKRPMKEIFGVPRLRKDGSEGSLVDLPPVEVMQRDPQFRKKWIEYSCYDAQGTYQIHDVLRKRLAKMDWYSVGNKTYNLYQYYWQHMRPFGVVLTDMERRGIRVNAKDYLHTVEIQARKDRDRHDRIFREWAATKIGPDGLALNSASSLQLGTFLFGGAKNLKTGEATEKVRVFKVPREEIPEDALEAFRLREEENSESEEKGKYTLDPPLPTNPSIILMDFSLHVA